jgi:hypothetical protein
MIRPLHIIISLLSIVFILGCKGEETEKSDAVKANHGKVFKFKNKLFSLPSPFHMTELIAKISEDFNSDLLNPAGNKTSYLSTEKKALNLGVYTADLGYCNVYEQYALTSQYIKNVRALSSELQILNKYTTDILNNIEKNLQNKDSLNRIFSETYRESDIYLSDNEREDVSVLIIAGGWIESMYLMTQITKVNKNRLLIERIGEQKYSLENIVRLMLQYKNQSTIISDEIIEKLMDLKKSYSELKINYQYDKHIVLPNEKKTIIISSTNIDMTEELLKEITDKIEIMREIVIK